MEYDYRYNGYSTTKTNYEQQLKKYQSVINTGSKVKYPYDIFDIIPVLNYYKAEQPVVTTTAQTTAATTLTTTTTQPVTIVSTPPVTDYARGDMTGDGEVSVDDAQLTLKAYTKRIAGNIHEKKHCSKRREAHCLRPCLSTVEISTHLCYF